MSYQVEVNAKKCSGCGYCIDVCPFEVFEIRDSKSVILKAEECIGCGSCEEVCDEDALTITEVQD